MTAGSLEECNFAIRRPDNKPVARVRNMAFASARPTSRKPVHIVPAPKNLHGLGRVLENKIDEALEFDEIPVAAMGLLFEVARERGGEFRRQPPHQRIAAAIRSAPLS